MQIDTIKNLSKESIIRILKRAIEFKNGLKVDYSDKSVAMLFLEPSTRTLLSFQKAAKNLKMQVFNLDVSKSSFKKGETLEDTMLNLKAMGIDNFVIRNTEEEYWTKFQSKLNFVNGGDGSKNHPSQALLDALTIYEHFGTLENLKVTIVGDIKHSRVFHSNKDLLSKFNSVVESFGPKSLGGDGKSINESLQTSDVVMMLRIQHERHSEKFDIKEYNNDFGLNGKNIKLLKENSIFMHPGPINRDVEISSELLYDHPQNKIMEQVTNGVYIRMALLEELWKNI